MVIGGHFGSVYVHLDENRDFTYNSCSRTGISSHLGAKLRDLAVRQAGAGCYSWAALSSNDSKTR